MNSLKNLYELIDISPSEDEEGLLERAATPLTRKLIPNFRVVLEISHSSDETAVDEEEYFDMSADSLGQRYKRMRLGSNTEMRLQQGLAIKLQEDEGLPDSQQAY